MMNRKFPSSQGTRIVPWLFFLPQVVQAKTYVLEHFDPSYFNALSDILAELTKLMFAVGAAYLYGLMLSFHLQRGNTLPVKALGEVPSSIFSLNLWRGNGKGLGLLSFSPPIVLFAILLLLNQFSHPIADLGLDFTAISQEGPVETVVTLDPAQRNTDILFQATGDPFVPEGITLIEGQQLDNLTDAEREKIQPQADLYISFLAAVDGIARIAHSFARVALC